MRFFGRLAAVLILAILYQASPGAVAPNRVLCLSTAETWGPCPAWANESWKQEFEAVCSRTGDAEALSKDELKALLARCDALKAVIEGLEESTRKVYITRLQACRDLYRYILESKGGNGPK